ncbi:MULTISPECIES: HAMP domain-containing sensor histidine kinase [unclassified Campylobacter]|uniref:HAMP domain-containing sensor histidine kinase n=1 Tax=unclassified Campylobacter TaxID=2593542 RepID=UPI001476098B|nr:MULTISPECIES: HAMP domain-containing sensor histidine kinase [unclassified Campylobacter]
MLIVIISVMLYYYIKVTIYEGISQSLMYEAKILSTSSNLSQKKGGFEYGTLDGSTTTVNIITKASKSKNPYFVNEKTENKTYLKLYFPYIGDSYITLTKETTMQSKLIDQILVDIMIVNATAIFLVLFYALFLSRMLLVPIKILSSKLSKLNERFLKEVSIDELPDEFTPLGKSINRLIGRIQTFVLYQKELFVGVAHELKTPLAVMKTKNEVTLLKPRDSEKYIEALKNNNEEINGMNKMIGSILEIGRQEGAQFEEAVQIDIIEFLDKMANNFKILARGDDKDVMINLSPKTLKMTLQPTLLTHIIQNFVQNAIKFSPPKSTITIVSKLKDEEFIVEVIDEGIGIDESKDLFAPFKRFGNKSGAGLGLFLAKGAAQALGGNVSIKNRTDGVKGVVSSLVLPILRNVKK